MFNRALLINPGRCKTAELETRILGGAGADTLTAIDAETDPEADYTNPEDAPTDAAMTPASYKYLLSLNSYQTSEEALARLISKRDELAKSIVQQQHENTIGDFAGAYEWQRELNEFERIHAEGARTEWTFGQKDKYKFE